MSKRTVQHVYALLLDAYGPRGWWPGESPFEVIVGAILVQNTAWRNVETAIERLKQAKLLRPRPLWNTSSEQLQELLRSTGYFRIKERRLRNFLDYLMTRHRGSLKRMFALPPDQLRTELLAINGIGPETADSILLYAGDLPSFVVDTYTQRVFKRHGWLPPVAGYHQTQRYFERRLPAEAPIYNEYHALLVHVGHHHCRKRPKCAGCPLECLLPKSGLVEM